MAVQKEKVRLKLPGALLLKKIKNYLIIKTELIK